MKVKKTALLMVVLAIFLVGFILIGQSSTLDEYVTPELKKRLAEEVAKYYMEREKISKLKGKEVIWLSNDFYKRKSEEFKGNFYTYRSVSDDRLWLIAFIGTRPNKKWLITAPIYMCSFHSDWSRLWENDGGYFRECNCTILDDLPDGLNLQLYFHKYDTSQLNFSDF